MSEPTSNLLALREAAAEARTDLAECLPEIRRAIAATQDAGLRALFARLEGNVHELHLLHKRELCLLEHGREPEAAAEVPMPENTFGGTEN